MSLDHSGADAAEVRTYYRYAAAQFLGNIATLHGGDAAQRAKLRQVRPLFTGQFSNAWKLAAQQAAPAGN